MKYINKDQLIAHRKRVLSDAQRHSVTKAARIHGLSRQTIYRWQRELLPQQPGPRGRSSWQTEAAVEQQVITMRKKTNFGPKRLRPELKLVGVVLGEKAIRGIVERAGLVRQQRKRRKKTKGKGFYAPYPGYRLQVDTKAVPDAGIDKRSSAARYQFTAIDICTRIRFCWLYDELSNANSIAFLRRCFDFYGELGIAIECVQTDNHSTFTNLYIGGNNKAKHSRLRVHPLTEFLLGRGVEHILSRPSTPQDNCFVERSHRTDEEEFYAHIATEQLGSAQLLAAIQEWNHVYNCLRLHSSCEYLPPVKYYREVLSQSVTGSGA